MATADLKMAAICMLVLTMMGQLMASAASASAPLVQADAAPTARRLLSADYERSACEKTTAPCPCLPPPMFSPVCCRGLQKAGDCPCTPWTPHCCSGLQKAGDCPCTPWTMWCCSGLQKTAENCPCDPIFRPWCCFGAGSAAIN
jgi:hypothetical protein